MKIYTYGIIDSDNGINRSLKGVEGASVYTIPYRDIGIAVSDLNGQILQDIDRERVLAHEKVVEGLMEDFTVLPIRFLTVFNGKKNVLSMMENYYGDFKSNLGRLHNKVEFGIKVIWPGKEIRERIIDHYTRCSHPLSALGESPGKRYIMDKFEKYKIDQAFEEEADRRIEDVDKFFSSFVAEKKLRRLKTENLLLDASYLLDKEKQVVFKKAFVHFRAVSDDLKYLLSGPWAPYNFISITNKLNQR